MRACACILVYLHVLCGCTQCYAGAAARDRRLPLDPGQRQPVGAAADDEQRPHPPPDAAGAGPASESGGELHEPAVHCPSNQSEYPSPCLLHSTLCCFFSTSCWLVGRLVGRSVCAFLSCLSPFFFFNLFFLFFPVWFVCVWFLFVVFFLQSFVCFCFFLPPPPSPVWWMEKFRLHEFPKLVGGVISLHLLHFEVGSLEKFKDNV